jgi:hypothetical protein
MNKNIATRINIYVGVDHHIKLNKACEITKENQSELIRRLINNEIHRLTDKPELIVHGNPAIAEKQLTYIIKQLSAIIKILETLQATAYHIHFDLLRTLFITTRTLFTGFKMKREDTEPLTNQSDKLAYKYMERVLATIGAGLQATLKVIMTKPGPADNPPKTQP